MVVWIAIVVPLWLPIFIIMIVVDVVLSILASFMSKEWTVKSPIVGDFIYYEIRKIYIEMFSRHKDAGGNSVNLDEAVGGMIYLVIICAVDGIFYYIIYLITSKCFFVSH